MATERNPSPGCSCKLTRGVSKNVNIGIPPELIVVPNNWIDHVIVTNVAKIPKNKYKQYTIGLVDFFWILF